MSLMKPEPGGLVPTLGKHLQLSIFPDSKRQCPGGKLSATRKLDIECPGCHGLPERILSASSFLVRLCRRRVVRYFVMRIGRNMTTQDQSQRRHIEV
jgi:hypothetical protein